MTMLTMQPKIIDQIPLRFDVGSVLRRPGLEGAPDQRALCEDLTRHAEAFGRPKAIYLASAVRKETDRSVVIDGVSLTSRVLRVNLDRVDRVFSFMATCGWELDRWAAGRDEALERRLADVISEVALYQALAALKDRLRDDYHLTVISRMSPGSLDDWPLPEQRPLFRLLGDTERAVGVRLTEDLMMLPRKSLSGILFSSEELFEGYLLCPREECPARLLPYDRDLFARKYA